jgi:alkylation response protein AidB-like acyl-CoA dehydrogenase
MQMSTMELTEEQRLLAETARRFTDDVVIPWVQDNRDREWTAPPEERVPYELLEAIDALGLRTLGVPEKYGGVALEHQAVTFAILAEELARGDSGFMDTLAQVWKVSVLLSNCAPEHLQDEWFPRIVADTGFLLAHALTEPRGASDRWLPYDVPEAAMHTKARREGDEWVLNGRKHFITNGYDAKLYVIYANTDPSRGLRSGTSSFLVPRDAEGFTIGRAHEKFGARFMNNGELIFEDCRVPADHLLVENEALGKAGVYFQPGKILQAAKNLGVGVAALEETSRYVQEFVQGGKVLIKHQVVAKTMAEMATTVESVRAMTRLAARAVDAGADDAAALTWMAKVFAADNIFDVCRRAMELHGGSGVMRDTGIEKHFRDAAMFLHMDGTADIHYFKIAKALFPATAGEYAGVE